MGTHDRPGCFAAIQRVFGLGAVPGKVEQLSSTVQEQLPYRVRDDFLSPAERSLYGVLCAAASDWATVCPKVSLDDLFYAQSGDHGANVGYRNRIARKHVDFLLCDPGSMRPVLGVELDDASHERAARQARDEFVDQVFAAAGLPLLRVPVQATYDTRALAAVVRQRVGLAGQASATPEEAPAVEEEGSDGEDAPASERGRGSGDSLPCPQCGRPMVLRTARRGAHEGERFWGCADYPRCRGVRAYGPAGEGERLAGAL